MSITSDHSQTAGWHVVPFREEHGPEVCAWCYEPPYDLYNWPLWADMLARNEEFADVRLRTTQYVAVINHDGEPVGFGQLFPLIGENGGTTVRLGLGMKPDLCGQGRGFGTALVRLLVAEARSRSPGCGVDLEVLTWNERAIRAYRKAGFSVTDTYVRGTPTGPGEFHCMVYELP